MRRLLIGLAFGMMLGSTGHAEEPPAGKLNELTVEPVGHASFKLPERYGRLVNVVISSEVHYLYFEDQAGTIRVVLVGPRGAVPRSRSPLQLLSSDVYLIKRGSGDEAAAGP